MMTHLFLFFFLFTTSSSTSASTNTNLMNHHQLVLNQLGYLELAEAIPTVFARFPSFKTWNGPLTIFAPPKHIIMFPYTPMILLYSSAPGARPYSELVENPVGTRLQTMSYGHCLIINTYSDASTGNPVVHVNGVPIHQPDLYNDGFTVVHGLASAQFTASTFPTSCGVDRMNVLLKFPPLHLSNDPLYMEPFVRDAMIRLSTNGLVVFASIMKMKQIYEKLVSLDNVTILAVEDGPIFEAGNPNLLYMARFHFLPNVYLDEQRIEAIGKRAVLPTLGDVNLEARRTTVDLKLIINSIEIKKYNIMKNLKVVVHLLEQPLQIHEIRTDFKKELEDNLPWLFVSSETWENYLMDEVNKLNEKKTQVFKAVTIKLD